MTTCKKIITSSCKLKVGRCTKIISPNTEDAKYVINISYHAKYVVGLGDKVSPTDIEEDMRVGVDPNKFHIQIPLPPKIDPSVTMMTVEEKLDVTYNDVGGCKEQIEKMRELLIAFNFLMLFFILMYFFLWLLSCLCFILRNL